MPEQRVYLDHSATTPVREEVREIMQYYFRHQFGNPSSLHGYGREAREGVEQARRQVAEALGVSPEEIYFTSGGTEADNLAVLGAARAGRGRGNHVITTRIEHHAVLDACQQLEREGFEVTYLPVDGEGLVQLEELERAIRRETILISVMHANNEIGTVQPLAEIARLSRRRGIILHTDAVQSLGKLPVEADRWGVDLVSASAHKLYGPKGVGCLYVRKGVSIEPLVYGGSQERKLRPGTENVAGIAGFGRAVELALGEMESLGVYLNQLRDLLWEGIRQRVEGVRLNGSLRQRVPGHLSVCFPGVRNADVLAGLDERGIAASAGSACTAEDAEPSHVLLAIGLPRELARGAVRLTLGRENTRRDVEYVLECLPEVLRMAREERPGHSGCSCCCG